MDFEWVALALGDVLWISLAFVFGFLSRSIGLPPLVGFLVTGFLLHAHGIVSGEVLDKLADLGITVLLFTVGLKLNPATLARPQVWGVSSLHCAISVVFAGFMFYGLALSGLPFFASLDLATALLIAFALSFSSTVFVVKALEDRGEMRSLHGRIAIGILIMQDLVAVIFLAVSAGKLPSPWAGLLFLLIPLRPLLLYILQRVGHGELLVLYGFLLSIGGAEVFELLGVKGDLGALIAGLLIANHHKAEEMARTMLGFKDLFLLGFFLSIGFSGALNAQAIAVALLLTPLVLLKSALFFSLLALFGLRARTALLASINLANYSEFGLIVLAISVANGWLESQWLVVFALATALSFVMAAILNTVAHRLYTRHRVFWRRLQKRVRLVDDRVLDLGRASIAIIGMGRVGTGAYDRMYNLYGDTVVGVDFDPLTVSKQCETGRRVLLGDPSDADFWDRVAETHSIRLVMLALPKLNMSLSVLEELKATRFKGQVAVSARYQDEVEVLKAAGATTVFNIYTEAGAGFAEHVSSVTAE